MSIQGPACPKVWPERRGRVAGSEKSECFLPRSLGRRRTSRRISASCWRLPPRSSALPVGQAEVPELLPQQVLALQRRHDPGEVGLVTSFGDFVYRLPNIELMRAGVLALVRNYLMAVREPAHLQWATWERAFEEGMVENERVNAMAGAAVKRFVRAGRPTLVLVRDRRQGFQVRDRLRYREKLPTVCIDGDTPTEERQEVQARLARGEMLAVVSTPALDVGVDLPGLRAVVLLSGGKSENKAIQRIGRGLRRKADGDNTVLVLDFLPRMNRYLYEHAKQRYLVYQSEQWPVQLVRGLDELDI